MSGWLKKSLDDATKRTTLVKEGALALATDALSKAYDLGYQQALKDNGLAPDHVCGLRGYDPMRDPMCPACEKSAREREAQRKREDDGA